MLTFLTWNFFFSFHESHLIILSLSALRGRWWEKSGEKGEDFQFEAGGFVSKPSAAWLNSKRTWLITGVSVAARGCVSKMKGDVPGERLWMLPRLEATTWQPEHLSSLICLYLWPPPGTSLCFGPSGHHYPRPRPCVRLDPECTLALC